MRSGRTACLPVSNKAEFSYFGDILKKHRDFMKDDFVSGVPFKINVSGETEKNKIKAKVEQTVQVERDEKGGARPLTDLAVTLQKAESKHKIKASQSKVSWEAEFNLKDFNKDDLHTNFKTTFNVVPEKRALSIGQLVKVGLPKLHDSVSLWFSGEGNFDVQSQSKNVTASLAAQIEKNYYLGSEAAFDVDKKEATRCEAVLAGQIDKTFAFLHADVFSKLFTFGASHKFTDSSETHAEASYNLGGDGAFSVALAHLSTFSSDVEMKTRVAFSDDLEVNTSTQYRWNDKTRIVLDEYFKPLALIRDSSLAGAKVGLFVDLNL